MFAARDRTRTDAAGGRVPAWLDETLQDLRYALRTLGRSGAFTATAVATLALAIGANTAMFSVVNAVVLRPLRYPAADQLAMVSIGSRDRTPRDRPGYLTVEEWRRRSHSFAAMAVLDPVSATLTDTGGAEKISVARVSSEFFPLLGVEPFAGRNFSSGEAEQRVRVALISDRFWHSHFGASREAIGASLVLDGRPSRIIGILPPGIDIPFYADVWEPHTLFADWEARRRARAGSWLVIARLQPGATLDGAQAEMSAIAQRLDEELPAAERNRGVTVVPLTAYVVGPRVQLALWVLMGALLCVLLIAAANVTSLSLARSTGRAREIAVRAALGASPRRIARQLITESLTLAATAGVVGTLLAVAGIRVIRAVGPVDLARLNETSLDVRVLGWALAISIVTGTLVGLAPALTASRWHLHRSGVEGGTTVSSGLATRRVRHALVVIECALTIVLLAGAGLLIRSWRQLLRVDPGFRSERVLSMQLSTSGFAPGQRASFYTSVVEQVESLPGVESAGIVGDLFIGSDSEQIVTAGPTSERVRLRVDEASERFFSTLGIPLRRGRFFSPEDRPDSPRVAIVNETMARRIWRGRDPIGSRFTIGPVDSTRPWFTVVGVVGDMRRQGLEIEPIPQVFEAAAQNPSALETLLVRTSSDHPLEMVPAIRAAISRVDKRAPLYGVTTLDDRLGNDRSQRRFQTALLIGFAVVALLMAAVGIYGLIHYSVATRTREIGIRMAVGARRGDIFRLIVREGLQLSVTGLMLGLLGALWVGRAGSSLLFGVTATDPLTFAAVSLLLTAVAITACYFPARRAMNVEPIVALRHT